MSFKPAILMLSLDFLLLLDGNRQISQRVLVVLPTIREEIQRRFTHEVSSKIAMAPAFQETCLGANSIQCRE